MYNTDSYSHIWDNYACTRLIHIHISWIIIHVQDRIIFTYLGYLHMHKTDSYSHIWNNYTRTRLIHIHISGLVLVHICNILDNYTCT